MSSTCKSCGSSIANPFDLSQASSDTCQCNLGGTVTESTQLPSSACCVESVNGKTGVVVLNIDDIDLLGNTFYSNAQVYAALSGTAPINFNPANGVISHNNSGVTAGTYGSASVIPVITVDDKGHVTSVSTQSIGSFSIGPDLTAIEALTGTGYAIRTATNTWVLRSIAGTAGRIAVSNGDGVAAQTVIDLVASGVSAGTYGGPSSFPVITVDTFGRITVATSQAIPPVVIPPHTHTLGNLSNVANGVDASAAIGDVLTWDGTEWTYSPIPLNYEQSTITLTGLWEFCTGHADIDAIEMDQDINLVQRHTDYLDKRQVSVNCAVYMDWATIQEALTDATTYKYTEIRIGEMPVGYRPIHNLTVPLASMLRSEDYWNTGHVSQFSGYQILDRLDLLITTDGDIRLFIKVQNDFIIPNDSGNEVIVVPISCTYPTKEIVP